MTGRWITVSLVALALAGCHKKEAAKPPPPTAETPAPPPAPAVTPVTPPPAAEPPADVTVTEPTPPAPGVTPTTTPDAPPSFVPAKPIRVIRPPVKVIAVKPGVKIVKTQAQVKAEHDVLGLWIEQKRRNSVLNFTVDGKVTQVEKITDKPLWKGEWKAGADGSVQFGLAMEGATSSLQFTAYPTAASIMAVAPHWTKEWGGSGQYAYEKMK